MNRVLVFTTFYFLMFNASIFAQKLKHVAGEYQLRVETNSTLEASKQKACDLARLQAIEEEFGRIIFQGNSTMIENVQSGNKVESKSVFNLMADTYANGEWIKDSKPNVVNQILKDNELWVTCKVDGEARELSRYKIDLLVEPLSCPERSCKSSSFNKGKDFYLNFKTPKNGYLVVFIDDRSSAYCIYPYQQMPMDEFQNFVFSAQKDYIFFSPKHKFKENWTWVDQLQMDTDKNYEKNRIFVLFSENPIAMPLLNDQIKESSGLTIPRSMKSEDFQRFIQKIRAKDEKMQLEMVDVEINGN